MRNTGIFGYKLEKPKEEKKQNLKASTQSCIIEIKYKGKDIEVTLKSSATIVNMLTTEQFKRELTLKPAYAGVH